jgi:copper chaperone CopZ
VSANTVKHASIAGMSCSGCSSRIKKLLEKHSDVSNADVDHLTGTASIEGEISEDEIKDIIVRAGFVHLGFKG